MNQLLEGLPAFVRVVETGSFTRAAADLAVTKSTVSEAVRRLEQRLGVRLLDRTTRLVTPTDAGRAYYERARRALDEAAAAAADARALQERPAGRLRVATPEVFAQRHIVPLLPAFLGTYPDLRIELVESAAAVDLLDAGVDLAIRITPTVNDTLIVRRLGSSRVVIVASPAYLAAHGVPRHPRDLAERPTLGFSPLHWGREWRFQGGSELAVVPVQPLLLSNAAETLRAAALAGVGLAALPSWMVFEELARGDLVQVLDDWRTAAIGIYAVYPSNRLLAAKVKLFADLIARRVRDLGLAE